MVTVTKKKKKKSNLRSRTALEENKMKDQHLGTIGTIQLPLHKRVSAFFVGGVGVVLLLLFLNTFRGCREQLWSSWLNSCITQTTQFHPGTLAHNVTACDWITRAYWIAESSYMETSCSLEVHFLLHYRLYICSNIMVFIRSLLWSCFKMFTTLGKLWESK